MGALALAVVVSILAINAWGWWGVAASCAMGVANLVDAATE
jgi:hypothetical protein